VLVVDDEALIRWSLVETFEQAGYGVTEAADAAAAIRLVSSAESFDVVVLDYRLPDSNDLSLLTTIKTVAPATAVILMTAFGAADIAEAAAALGAHCVMSKPFDMGDMPQLVLQAAARTRRHLQTIGRTMATDEQSDKPRLHAPFGELERSLIDEFLRRQGYERDQLDSLPAEERDALLKRASLYASVKMAEIESRSNYTRELRDGAPPRSNSGGD
jgi:two-component system response regulator (stage 0 sporulation protein F)